MEEYRWHPARKNIILGERLPPPGQAKKQIEDLVAAAVARLEKAWQEYQANADLDRDAIYLYLEPVYSQVRKWKSQGVADEYSLIALKQGIPGRVKGDPYVRLIYCSSTKDRPKKAIKMGESHEMGGGQHQDRRDCLPTV